MRMLLNVLSASWLFSVNVFPMIVLSSLALASCSPFSPLRMMMFPVIVFRELLVRCIPSSPALRIVLPTNVFMSLSTYTL